MTFPPSRRLGINIYQQLICKNKEIWDYHLYCKLFKNQLQPQIQALIEEEESKKLKSYSQTVTQIMNPVIASLETQNKALQALLLGRDPASSDPSSSVLQGDFKPSSVAEILNGVVNSPEMRQSATQEDENTGYAEFSTEH